MSFGGVRFLGKTAQPEVLPLVYGAAPLALAPILQPTPGMLAWYAADQITSPPSSGSALSSWNDLSVNGYTMTQSTGANQPTYNTNQLNGLPAVTFNGTTDGMSNTSIPAASLAQPVTIVAVITGTGNRFMGTYFGDWRVGGNGVSADIYAGTADVTGSGATTGWACTTLQINGSSSIVRQGGAQIGSGNPGSGQPSNPGLALGAEGNSLPNLAQQWAGTIAEVLVYASALSLTQMQQTERYLRAKWAV